MHFPLPDGLFPPVRVAEDDAGALRQLADLFVRNAVDEFQHFRVSRGGVVDDSQWKFVKQRRGLSAFADRTLADVAATARAQVAAASNGLGDLSADVPVVGNMSLLSTKLHAVMVVGSVEGELHDLMYGLHHSSTRELQLIKSSYMKDNVVDSKILAAIDEPTVAEPLRGLHLKWVVSEIAPFAARVVRKVLRPRDFVYLEAIGFVTTAKGERLGYNVLHSLQIPGVRELSDFQIVRANYSICSVFRQSTPGAVEVFMKGFVDAMGDIPASLAIPGSAKALMSYRKGVYCGQMKKLNWLIKNGEKKRLESRQVGGDTNRARTPSRAECSACGRQLSMSKAKTCKACTAPLCEACVVPHRLSFLARPYARGRIVLRPIDFCPSCILSAMATDTVQIASDELKQRRDPRETFECSSASDSTSQQPILSPSNSELPDAAPGALLSPSHYEQFLGIARHKHKVISRVTRILSLAYLGILLPSSAKVRMYITCVLFLSLIPLVFVIGLLSLDVVAVLAKSSYEYRFLTLINSIHWLSMAVVYDDVRSFMCIASWISLQTMLTLDANFRTFASATKTVSAAVPGMILLGMLCAMNFIADGRDFDITYRSFAYSSGDIISFTSSTLAIFMIKLAIRKHLSKSGHASLDCAIVYCVMLKARLELVTRRERPRCKGSMTIRAMPTAFGTISRHAKQPLKLHSLARFIVDARRTLVSKMLTRTWVSSRAFRVVFGAMGAIGVVATTTAWIAVLGFQAAADTAFAVTTSAVGAACSTVFVALFVSFSQRDLLWTLVYTFDYNFSVFQAVSLAICLADMSNWTPSMSLAALSWWLWFQWLLLLDAIPPAARKRLGFTKKLAAPVMVLVLLGTVLLAARIICSNSRPVGVSPLADDTSGFGLLRNRRLINWQPSAHHNFQLRTFDFSLQRVLTILGWNSRLAVALVTGSEHELLFVRGFTRYATPFDTFPPNANTQARQRGKTEVEAPIRASRVLPSLGLRGSTSIRLSSSASSSLSTYIKANLRRKSGLQPIEDKIGA